MLNTNKIKIGLLFCLLTISLTNVHSASAQAKMAEDCPISITVAVSPNQVTSWKNRVNITTTLRREFPAGYYCSTNDIANITLFYSISGSGKSQTLRTGNLTLPPNPTGQGATTTRIDQYSEDFSVGGATNQGAIAITAYARVQRQAGSRTTNFDIQTAQAATITLNPSTTQTQNPSTTPTGNANSANQTPSNSNSPTKDPFVAPNTNVGLNYNVNLDEKIGDFFNPLKVGTLPEIVTGLIRILFALIGIVSIIIIIIAGFRMVLASGNEAELTKAKQAITWAIVGLVVSLLSFSIVAIIQRLIQVGAN